MNYVKVCLSPISNKLIKLTHYVILCHNGGKKLEQFCLEAEQIRPWFNIFSFQGTPKQIKVNRL